MIQFAARGARALNNVADDLREVGLMTQAGLLQRLADELSKLHHDMMATTQPIDLDPWLELHLRLPWREDPDASDAAVKAFREVGERLVKLRRGDAQVVVYGLVKAYLDPDAEDSD